jgi:2-dehydro-3-deoxyphosphogluconate aldolase/(4S)-4-hydroxy-2-oxoglutarate aldolase
MPTDAVTRLDVYNTLLSSRLIVLFTHPDPETAARIAVACLEGGARLIEFILRGDGALASFTALAQRLAQTHPQAILGAGTVMDAPTAALCLAAGARFIVSPNLNPDIARLCNRRKAAYIPGCATPTEITQAEELGAEVVKVFPAQALGPGFIKAVLGPSPWSRLMPTGGVAATQASIRAWLDAGACAVGLGGDVVRAEEVEKGDYDAIRQRVMEVIGWIQEAEADSN